MLPNKFSYFLFFSIVLITGCDMSNEKKYPKILRFGDDKSLSNYIFENTKNNILISPSNMHPGIGNNVTSWISVGYPNKITGIKNYFSVNVTYRKYKHKYKDLNSFFVKSIQILPYIKTKKYPSPGWKKKKLFGI